MAHLSWRGFLKAFFGQNHTWASWCTVNRGFYKRTSDARLAGVISFCVLSCVFLDQGGHLGTRYLY